MKARFALSGLALTLAACACNHRPAPAEKAAAAPAKPHRVQEFAFTKGAYPQIERLRWTRPGSWQPIDLHPPLAYDRVVGLVARDGYGDRVIAPTVDGYEIQRVKVTCSPASMLVMDGRRYDAKGVQTKAPIVPLGISNADVSALCALPRDKVIHADATQAAAQVMKQAQSVSAPAAKKTPAPHR